MLKRPGKKTIVLVFVSLLIFGSAVALPVIYFISDRLSVTERAEANILIVEGWLPHRLFRIIVNEELQKYDYDYIVTTGLEDRNEYFNFTQNGYLIFYLENNLSSETGTNSHIIEVDAFSELEGEHAAHFNLWINDSLVTEFVAGKKKKEHSLDWKGYLNDIDSVMVQFTNDSVGDFGDRNLFVKSLIIDKQTEIPYLNNSIYDVGKIDNKRRTANNASSNAEIGRNIFISYGIDPDMVIAVPGNRVRINRTLTSALAFRDWLRESDIKIEGINIVSVGTHSRRTWMAFDKVLDSSIPVGIISLPDYKNQNSRKRKVLKTIRETVGLAYYWVILLPY
jgi:hypothetical protein